MAGKNHDSLYHRLFSHPGMVAQLLREFVAGPWLDDLDLDAMERLNAKFHAATGERREGDMAWRIPRRDGSDAYLVLMLEFQSVSDRWMALRVLLYGTLLWDHLVREKRLPSHGRLPPLLPVVLYNGDARWTAAPNVAELVGLPEESPLWQWQPGLRYHVIDEGGFSDADLARRDGLPALLFRMEASRDPDEAFGLAHAALAWIARHPGFDSLRAAIVDLLNAAVAPEGATAPLIDDPMEARHMLATNAEVWKRQWKDEGRLVGQADLLIRQLTRRFGDLPGWAVERIRAADEAALETWSLRVLDAKALDDALI